MPKRIDLPATASNSTSNFQERADNTSQNAPRAGIRKVTSIEKANTAFSEHPGFSVSQEANSPPAISLSERSRPESGYESLSDSETDIGRLSTSPVTVSPEASGSTLTARKYQLGDEIGSGSFARVMDLLDIAGNPTGQVLRVPVKNEDDDDTMADWLSLELEQSEVIPLSPEAITCNEPQSMDSDIDQSYQAFCKTGTTQKYCPLLWKAGGGRANWSDHGKARLPSII